MAKTDHDFSCPIGEALEVFAGRWKPEIIWVLRNGSLRFNQLRREIGGVSQKMLTQQLRELQRDGLVSRKQYEEIPPRVEYRTTELTRSLEPVFKLLTEWRDKNNQQVVNARHRYDGLKKE